MKSPELFNRILGYVDLDSDVDDYDKIHETIEKDIVFKGTNLWILAFAIIIASVGLNVNSTAVIIGAMLISPLMGPINGMGYSIATYNTLLFRKALKNFSFAVAASLVASTAYFSISPLSTAHSELLARTSPTIYDVIIALFGGMAGIVAISSKHKGNVIPGVAIATALMPPLCTAGYGLATFQLNYFLGALFLFTINTVFIAISSVIISQILKFPIRTIVNPERKKRINQWISFVILLVTIPSIYFGYNLVKQEKFMDRAKKYIATVSITDDNYLLKNEINPQKNTISLVYGGVSLTKEQKKKIREKALEFSLDTSKIEFRQGLAINKLTDTSTEVDNLSLEMKQLKLLLQEKEHELATLNHRNKIGREILSELKILYPHLNKCYFSDAVSTNDSLVNSNDLKVVILISENGKIPKSDQKKIEDWLKSRLKSENIKVFFQD
jgi:uncharacterized hydrophobic protein (TIGR00271 family)